MGHRGGQRQGQPRGQPQGHPHPWGQPPRHPQGRRCPARAAHRGRHPGRPRPPRARPRGSDPQPPRSAPLGLALHGHPVPPPVGRGHPRTALLRHRGRRGPPPRPRGQARRAPLGGGRLGAPAPKTRPPDPPQRAAEPGAQDSLFDPAPAAPLPFEALLEVYAEQLRRHGATAHPGRMRLLTAAESAGTLIAAEMNETGLPWRADVHRDVLTELLGERYGGSGEPRRLAELADEVSAAFGHRVRPDLPADVVKAFARAGIRLRSTRRWELEEVDHPAVAPLLTYKSLYRVWTAHGWSWLQDWVRDGRFRPQYTPGGSVSGRWTTNGGGALQIPKVIRRAVVADPGWRLVVADADQLEPRVLAAISRDRGLMDVAASPDDLYTRLSDRAFSGDREHAKLALLGAVYGQTSGDGLKNLAALRRRFPKRWRTSTTRRGRARRDASYAPGSAAPARPRRARATTRTTGPTRRASPRRPRTPQTPKEPKEARGPPAPVPAAASPATSSCRAAPPTGRS
ncbi:bifunctional 3'-5' exonuclease/DNA polymerase [Streptomyces sp. G45]|uniref:bifunctional 3'-5' exonuclease/DNA polymerase n=1 Tax=Streptomyces sp. G45 TaxID=3406627 RepID=UPI003C16ECBE